MSPRREDIGSWMDGTPGPSGAGSDLGLPAEGRGSRAPLGPRVVGLLVDWAVASLISSAFFGYDAMATLAVFFVSTAVLVSTTGFTLGHRAAGLQVVRVADVVGVTAGRPVAASWPPPGLLLGTLRTFLLCLVIPPVVWDSSGRGLHDVAAGTVVVRRRGPRVPGSGADASGAAR